MKYIECPEEYDHPFDANKMFLAGGISNCPDWQSEMVRLLSDTHYTIYNPRRKNFSLADSRPQIEWEFKYLSRANHIIFWFPEETLCPITLFEYGKALGTYRDMDGLNSILYVGCHPNYKRKIDLEIQTELVDGSIKIANSLEELAQQVINPLINEVTNLF